jgi:hypothetical protein
MTRALVWPMIATLQDGAGRRRSITYSSEIGGSVAGTSRQGGG